MNNKTSKTPEERGRHIITTMVRDLHWLASQIQDKANLLDPSGQLQDLDAEKLQGIAHMSATLRQKADGIDRARVYLQWLRRPRNQPFYYLDGRDGGYRIYHGDGRIGTQMDGEINGRVYANITAAQEEVRRRHGEYAATDNDLSEEAERDRQTKEQEQNERRRKASRNRSCWHPPS